jgi:hypothetical protein
VNPPLALIIFLAIAINAPILWRWARNQPIP